MKRFLDLLLLFYIAYNVVFVGASYICYKNAFGGKYVKIKSSYIRERNIELKKISLEMASKYKSREDIHIITNREDFKKFIKDYNYLNLLNPFELLNFTLSIYDISKMIRDNKGYFYNHSLRNNCLIIENERRGFNTASTKPEDGIFYIGFITLHEIGHCMNLKNSLITNFKARSKQEYLADLFALRENKIYNYGFNEERIIHQRSSSDGEKDPHRNGEKLKRDLGI